jgi:hypothetical protein
MKSIRILSRVLHQGLVVGVLLGTVGADAMTIKWQEETPLNNGEILWVTRTRTYAYGGEPGNPLSLGWTPKAGSLSFVWRGNKYSYEGSAMVVAVDPAGGITLIRPIGLADILERGIRCQKPSYVQMRAGNDGWTVLKKLESWTYNLPRNQMIPLEKNEMPVRVTAAMRNQSDRQNSFFVQHKAVREIDPTFVSADCKGRLTD